MKTFAIFLLSKETFTIGTCCILESFFRKLLSKATFEGKLSSVSLSLGEKFPSFQLSWAGLPYPGNLLPGYPKINI